LATDFAELREKMLQSAKEGIKEAYSSEEYALIQAINAHLETSKSYNLVYERLTEWAGIYFPEKRFTNPKTLAEFALESTKGDETSAIGRKMGDDEKKAIEGFAEMSNSMDKTLTSLEEYVKLAANRMMPNTVYLTDEKIAAELLSKAGSMDRLATMPASTIQLLGAEKSLFKHLKFGSKPPKYGILFKMPVVNTANRDQRGRIARVYATKISIALKADHYTKRFIAKELKASLDATVEKIKSSPARERKPTTENRPDSRRPFNRRPNNKRDFRKRPNR
jgi:nucleolar protein 56